MMERREVQPASVARPAAAYSQAVEVKAERLLFIAGQVSVNGEGELVGPGDIRAQTRQVFENIKAMVEEAGGTMANIVKLTTFMTNMDDFAAFSQVRTEYITEPYPAATLVEVRSLVRPEWLVEVEAIAAL